MRWVRWLSGVGVAAGCTDKLYAGDHPPDVVFLSPEPNVVLSGDELTLVVEISDKETPVEDIEITFASDKDGRLDGDLVRNGGEISFTTGPLSVAYHDLVATAVDNEGQEGIAFLPIGWVEQE